MANTIIAGNGTNNGLAVTSDATGALNILTGSGGGTAAISIDSSQNVTMAANQTVTGNLSVTGNTTITGTITATGGVSGGIRSGTAVASTSGTSIDFTSLPTGIKRITVMFNGVSTSGTSLIQVQIGDSGGIETTSYASGAWTANTTNANSTTGFIIHGANASAARVWDGAYTIVLQDAANTWIFNGMCNSLNDNAQSIGIGRKQVSATLDRIRITTVNGTDTFDAGSINILYE
jgi:hypothetical protein